MNGLGYPQWAAISPAAGPFHNPDVTQYAYDLKHANDLLDGLGWFDLDGDGFREDDEAAPFPSRWRRIPATTSARRSARF